MSTKTEPQAAPQVDHQQLLIQKVAQPAFFAKLAQDHGIVPQSVEEAQALLNIGDAMFNNYNQNQAKQAAARGSLILKAHQGLMDHGQAAVDGADTGAVKFASQILQNDPGLIQSALHVQRETLSPAASKA